VGSLLATRIRLTMEARGNVPEVLLGMTFWPDMEPVLTTEDCWQPPVDEKLRPVGQAQVVVPSVLGERIP
jgi:hypothetical protein